MDSTSYIQILNETIRIFLRKQTRKAWIYLFSHKRFLETSREE